jgi:hypothetical protein
MSKLVRFSRCGQMRCRYDAFSLMSPLPWLGWGYDFTWPLAIDAAKPKMGIADAVPVSHKLQKPVANMYIRMQAGRWRNTLAARPYLKSEEALYIVESFA